VRIEGVTLTAVSDHTPAIDAPVALAVRPEKIGFRDGEAPGAQARLNALPAVVRDVTFVGEMHRYVVQVAPGLTLVAKQQHRYRVRARAPQERVTVEWHIEDTLVI